MKFFARTLLLFVLPWSSALGQAAAITGDWTGTGISHGQQVPVHLQVASASGTLSGSLLNGPEIAPASTTTFIGNHLLLTYPYFARSLEATLSPDGTLSGSFGTTKVRYPLTLHRATKATAQFGSSPAIEGDWEIAVHSAKGEAAWQLRVAQQGSVIQAVIQRIDGDTGSLYGAWSAAGQTPQTLRLSHFTPAGPALYALMPQSDGTLLISNLLRADAASDTQQNLVARRPAAARAAHLEEPTDSTQQTTMKDPAARFQFSAPDLAGHLLTDRSPRFDGKVVIVAVGGSWCPNCHDEAPMLQSLYEQFHQQGLEVVDLSFEEDEDQLKNPERLRAFIARYHIQYPVLVAGTTEELNEKIPQADHLNCWPTSFILGRDGRVRQIHAGFAGPANPAAHQALVEEITTLVTSLLQEPVPVQTAQATP